jgi:hypothetical protein
MSSMIVELLNTISSQEGNIEEMACQRTLLPAPAIEGKTINLRESVRVVGLTFPMNP